ncbi:MAG: alpha/beta hydrolase [archaeon]|nr:alpha/beta hydrolase [archaeon]
MEYLEKDLPPYQVTDMPSMDLVGKLPSFMLKIMFKLMLKKFRSMMGGDSIDMTTRAIISEDKTISGFKSDVLIRIYKPKEDPDKIRPLLVFFHGGGYFGGSIGAVEEYCKGVSDQADCVVINVDYHLAPEHPYPEGLEDNYNAIKWAVENKSELNIDENKIIVGGDSAGGGFSASLSFMAKDRKEFSIAKQILIYPATTFKDEVQESEAPAAMLKVSSIMTSLYIKGDEDITHPYISPALAKDFSNLPDALIAVGEDDFLYAGSKKYAEKLDKAGNKVRFILYKNANHAFIDDTGNSEQANDLVHEAALFILEN